MVGQGDSFRAKVMRFVLRHDGGTAVDVGGHAIQKKDHHSEATAMFQAESLVS
jgi:hypothetical protein